MLRCFNLQDVREHEASSRGTSTSESNYRGFEKMSEGPQETGTVTATIAEPRRQTEGEMVIDLLKQFQQDLAVAKAENDALRAEINLLNVKVNKEMPAQLDAAFREISQNFQAITKGIEAIPRTQQSTVAAAAAQQKDGGPVEKILNTVLKRLEGGETGTPGSLSDFDKEILKTSKQIQLLSLRDMLKKTAKSAGIELSDHVVVS